MKFLYLVGLLSIVGCASSAEVSSGDAGYPDCPFHVYRHNGSGWLVQHPEVHFVYWGQYWLNNQKDQNQYLAPWNKLLNGGTVLDRLTEYGIGSGTFDTTAYNTNPGLVIPSPGGGTAADSLLDASAGQYTVLPSQYIPLEINNEIQAGELPVPDSNTFYAILIPPGYIPTNDSNLSLGGYHGFGTYGSQPYTFAAILYSPWFDETMGIVSHELYEAATDPDLSGGYRDDGTGEEVADLCQVANENWWETIDGESVQKVWSQSLCQCQ